MSFVKLWRFRLLFSAFQSQKSNGKIYFAYMEFDNLVVHKEDDPEPDVYYYNKPHDQFCFARITMLST